MIDPNGAAQSLLGLSTNTFLRSLGVNCELIVAKSSWNVMIAGTYALLEPHMHKDYKTSFEIEALMKLLDISIKTTVQLIFNTHVHPFISTAPGTPGITTPSPVPIAFIMPPAPMIPMEIFTTKISRVVEVPDVASAADLVDMEVGVPQIEPLTVYAFSPVIGLL